MPFVNFIEIKNIFSIHLFQDPGGSFQFVFLCNNDNENNNIFESFLWSRWCSKTLLSICEFIYSSWQSHRVDTFTPFTSEKMQEWGNEVQGHTDKQWQTQVLVSRADSWNTMLYAFQQWFWCFPETCESFFDLYAWHGRSSDFGDTCYYDLALKCPPKNQTLKAWSSMQ